MARNKPSFDALEGLFTPPPLQPDTPESASRAGGITQIALDKLMPYPNQPFKPYTQTKLDELSEDISRNGIISPVVVRPLHDGVYQILAGHNRVSAAMLAGLSEAPCMVRDVDDETAKLIMVNSNLMQRDELLPSEKAFAYKIQLEALSCQGKRTDLGTNGAQVDGANNLGTNGAQVRSRDILAHANGESRETIRRYIRLTYLIPLLLAMVDDKSLPFQAAVNISYLKSEEQTLLHHFILKHKLKINLDQSKLLKMKSDDHNFGDLELREVFGITGSKKSSTSTAIKLSYKKLESYIQPGTPDQEIVEYILEALEYYRSHKEG